MRIRTTEVDLLMCGDDQFFEESDIEGAIVCVVFLDLHSMRGSVGFKGVLRLNCLLDGLCKL